MRIGRKEVKERKKVTGGRRKEGGKGGRKERREGRRK
jgi:hypothetical protein